MYFIDWKKEIPADINKAELSLMPLHISGTVKVTNIDFALTCNHVRVSEFRITITEESNQRHRATLMGEALDALKKDFGISIDKHMYDYISIAYSVNLLYLKWE